ncbi:MAG: TlpA family protein disulfide reductase [Gammaproteobacteria bacterium]|nr:TlpA family protein disulfide reductase [Gammaproteobacteria bacterium]
MLRAVTLLLLLCSAAPHAADRVVTTPSGDDIPVSVSGADSDHLLLWLGSEFGGTPRRTALAEAIAATGAQVWSVDLHAAWFLPVGRYSLNDVDPAAIAALIDAAVAHAGHVYLMAEGRVAALALSGVRTWQLAEHAGPGLRGLLTFSPRLYTRTPQGGESAEYLAIAAASNLPIYVLQPEASAGFWRIGQDVRELEKGGADVFVHRLPDVSDGFYARPEFTPAEQALTDRLPAILKGAMAQLDARGGTPTHPAAIADGVIAPERPEGSALLRPYTAERDAPELRLSTLRGSDVDLAALRGRVVLVNFWATWCPPCVKEIPSLQALYGRLHEQGLAILAVDVGEIPATLEAFLKDKPVEFPVLLDQDGQALRRWGVYAFPTTLVVDRDQRIRYAVFGAFDWSSDEVVETLQTLLAIPPR